MTEKTLTQRFDELRKNAPGPTVEPNSQDWAALGGAVAHHLIERHAGNWADVELMMEEFAAARVKTATRAIVERLERACGAKSQPPMLIRREFLGEVIESPWPAEKLTPQEQKAPESHESGAN